MLLSAALKSQQSPQTVTRLPSSCIEFRPIFTCTDFNITWSVFNSRRPLPPPTNALLYPLSLRARVQIVRLTPGICWEHKTNSTSKHNFLPRDTSKAKQLYKSSPHNPITSFLPDSRHIQIQRPTVPPFVFAVRVYATMSTRTYGDRSSTLFTSASESPQKREKTNVFIIIIWIMDWIRHTLLDCYIKRVAENSVTSNIKCYVEFLVPFVTLLLCRFEILSTKDQHVYDGQKL